ncbi:alpha/beta hydrolase [Flammeovirga aprica JL-4]|uniref:Alpha/beta hydrolase n=2 Tax=Flammeovirga aprica TaxID=29528 RepID=A0A7X9XBE2_9BACT|nr:alpha/beta hydrolase [Flammeovirga aprica JL-4]
MPGYPTNRNTFDELIPMLASHYYVIVPDHSNTRWYAKFDPEKTPFTFSLITDYLEYFLKELKIDNYTLYIQNSSFHIGLQLMERDPDKIEALIIQNSELYIDALPENRQALYKNTGSDSSNAYMDYVWTLSGENADILSKDITPLDSTTYDIGLWQQYLEFVQTEKQKLIMMQLLNDYNKLAQRFPDWQQMLKEKQPKTLVIWGNNDSDPNFEGANSFKKDLPDAELLLIKSGKFSNKLFNVEVASKVLNFLQRNSGRLDDGENIKPYLDAL